MYNQFVDEEGQERQIQYLVELGFPEGKARKGVEKFGFTISLEDLINRILDMSEDNSKKSMTHNKISLIQFSESGSEKSPPLVQQQKIVNAPYQQQQQQQPQQRQQITFYSNQHQISQPFENEQFQQCQVCFTQPIQWIHFECKHQFCQPCVVKNIKAQRLKKLELITCLQQDCHDKIVKDDAHLVSNELFPQMDIQPYNEPICSKCKLPQAAHRFTLFSNACDNAEFTILSACVRQDEDGNQLQRCPQCGIWVQKSKGCNSVLCSYCKFNWCWLCRRQCDSNHFVQFNPTGCPGLGSEEFALEQWPWHKICWKRVKAVLIYFLLLMLCVIIYPFFVGQVVIRKMNFNIEGNLCYRVTIYIFLGVLFLILSTLAIFPGIIVFIVSPRARQYVFAR